jgi:D-alanine-D-alanine ligase
VCSSRQKLWKICRQTGNQADGACQKGLRLKTTLNVALVYSSKHKALEVASYRYAAEPAAEDEKPPDQLAEYDTEETIAALYAALSRKYKVTRLEGDVTVFEKLRALCPDFVFNISEGFGGANRESHIPIVCEMLDLPCLGSDALTLGICLDKARAKEILLANHLPTPAFRVVYSLSEMDRLADFPLPAIVKPLREGSSIGIGNASLVRTTADLTKQARVVLQQYAQPVLVEEFLPGREFTVGLLGNASDWEILPLVEIDYSVLPAGASPIYGYEAKWVWDDPAHPLDIHVCPAKASPELVADIHTLVLRTASVMRLRDWCRMDIRLDAAGFPKIIELNPLPGVLPDPNDNSALPTAARAAGYNYDDLILRVAEIAMKRCGLV